MATLKERVLMKMELNVPVMAPQLMAKTDVPRSAFYSTLSALVADGVVSRKFLSETDRRRVYTRVK